MEAADGRSTVKNTIAALVLVLDEAVRHEWFAAQSGELGRPRVSNAEVFGVGSRKTRSGSLSPHEPGLTPSHCTRADVHGGLHAPHS